MSGAQREADGHGQQLPPLPPLPEITDTSYMTAAFKAPPRNPVLAGDEEAAVEAQLARDNSEATWNAELERESDESEVAADGADSSEAAHGERPAARTTAADKIDEVYNAAEAHFMATYRNPLEEEIKWQRVRVRVPGIWWILLGVFAFASALLFFDYMNDSASFTIHSDTVVSPLAVAAAIGISVIGVVVTFMLIRKPPFWSLLHLVLALVAAFWGFGGVIGLTLVFFSNTFLSAVDATSKAEAVKAVAPLALWGGAVLVIPVILVHFLLPPWERRAALLRLFTSISFWGAYAGVTLVFVLPHMHGRATGYMFAMLLFIGWPVLGLFAAGVTVALPVLWPIPRNAVVPKILGVLVSAFGFAVLFAVLVVPDVQPAGRVVLTILTIAMVVEAFVFLALSSRAQDPLRRSDMEGLQVWVDADILHADEHDFMCDEKTIHLWAREALRRGVFLAARDFYRATSELAFTDADTERGTELATTVRITRRKLEAAGVPPRPDFAEFSEKPIFPDPLD